MATKQGRFQFFTSVMWRNNKFLHNCQDFTILHICHVKKSEIPLHFSDFSPFAMYRNLKFLHMTDFSPHVSHVNYVTNMRYAHNFDLMPTQLCLFSKFLWLLSSSICAHCSATHFALCYDHTVHIDIWYNFVLGLFVINL